MKHLRINASELPGPVAAPWRPKAIELLFIGALLATLTMLIFPNSAHAKLIGLEAAPGSPDINTNGTFINYDYVGGGAGGQLTISSYASDGKVTQDITLPAASQWGTVAPGVFKIRDPEKEGTADFGRTGYTLTANFNDAGVFTDGTVTITGAIDAAAGFLDSTLQYIKPLDPTLGDATTNPCFQICSGWTNTSHKGPATLLVGQLLGFGFKATPDVNGNYDALQMDWYMETVGGDMFTAGWTDIGGFRTDVGVIASGLVTWGNGLNAQNTGTFDPLGVTGWDPLDNNTTTAFLQDFRSCDPAPIGAGGGRCEVLLDTFVPVPAAVWLFGSGLLGLTGMGVRNRRRNRSTV